MLVRFIFYQTICFLKVNDPVVQVSIGWAIFTNSLVFSFASFAEYVYSDFFC